MKTILKEKLLFFVIILILGMLTSFSLPPYNFFLINFVTIPALFVLLIKQRLKLNKIEYFFMVGYLVLVISYQVCIG